MTDALIAVGKIADIPLRGSRIVRHATGDIAVFRAADDTIFALPNACPHKGGPLSEGIVHGHSVTCPLHGRVVDLRTGRVEAPEHGCAGHVTVVVEPDGTILLELSSVRVALAAE